jgi:predicted membrane channel-forming protein YqfA (hemolysin III family)
MMTALSTQLALESRLYEWLAQTRTSFSEQDLQLPWWFGLCCWSYAVAGIAMIWTQPSWTSQTRFPYQSFACILIFLQSPLSFLADYCYMTQDSYWHVADRLLACPAMMLEMTKFAIVCCGKTDTPLVTRITYGTALLVACVCFCLSQEAQGRLDRDAFVLWHNAWHLYPLIGSVIMLLDFYLLGGWRRSTRTRFYAVEFHFLNHRFLGTLPPAIDKADFHKL